MSVRGKLYGIGVGPGDPELVTLKACRLINEKKYIAYPGKVKEDTMAYNIVKSLIEKPEEKEYISCYVQMTKDRAILDANYDKAAAAIIEVLDKGEDVCYITIGDPTIYATYYYVHQRVVAAGYEAEMISGIPSFCAVAARVDKSLGERAEMIHIIPSSYEIDDALALPGNKILMKSASKIGEVKEKLVALDSEVYMVENCCLENERVFMDAESIDENSNYMSVIIVKDKNR